MGGAENNNKTFLRCESGSTCFRFSCLGPVPLPSSPGSMICFAPCQTGLVSETNQGRGCVGHVFPTKAPVLFNLFLCLLAAFFNRYFGLFSLPNKCMCFIIIVIFAAMMDCRLIGLQPTEVYFSQFCRLRHPRSGCLHDLILMREPF